MTLGVQDGPYTSIYDLPVNYSVTSFRRSNGKDAGEGMYLGFDHLRQTWERRLAQAREETQRYRAHWSDVAAHFDPESGYWLSNLEETTRGGRIDTQLINSKGAESFQNLRAGLSSGMTPNTLPFWHLESYDPSLNKDLDVMQWLHDVTWILRSDQLRSNAYQTWQQGHGDLILFGIVTESMDQDEELAIRMNAHPVGTYHLMTGAHGRVHTLYEDYRLTTVQMVETFGVENCSAKVQEAWINSKGLQTKHKLIHVVEPNDDRQPNLSTWRGKPYVSGWYEPGAEQGKLLAIEGFWEQPFTAARWNPRGSQALSLGPSSLALGHVKQLQSTEFDKARLEEWYGNPALVTPSSMLGDKDASNGVSPGDRLTVPDGITGKQVYSAYEPHPNAIQFLEASISAREQSISRLLFEDVFFAILQLDSRSGRTATEILERRQDALQKLAPMVSGQHFERFGPQIDRHFNIRLRANALPTAPEKLIGQPIKVVYTSAVAQAMKATKIRTLDHMLLATQGVMGIDPTAGFMIEGAKFIEAYREGLELSPDLLRDEQEAQEMAMAAQQSAAQAQLASSARDGAAAAKDAAQAETEGGGSVLDRVLEQMGGGQPQ